MIRLKLNAVFVMLSILSICKEGRGSSSKCFKDYGKDLKHFAVLPGFGWDNLRNVEVSRVVEFNYSRCQVTNDGLYLLPNGVDTISLKESKLDSTSEVFDKFTEFTSITSRSINQDGGFNFPGMKISGSFSRHYLKSKNIQIQENTTVVRSQLRYVKYKAKLQPDASLSTAFKIALLNIARHVLYGRTKIARYESEQLVRDFGTHVITSIHAGTALVQEDHLDSTYAQNGTLRKDVLLGASMTLKEATGIGLGVGDDAAMIKIYKENRFHSFIKTYGGPVFVSNPVNNSWVNHLDDNLVAIDREGIPVYNFVNVQTLPIIPSSILYDVTRYIKQAVKDYYAYNTYQGCTDPDKAHFNPQANIDDGSCEADVDVDAADVYFGGVYQMCDVVSKDAGDLCSHLKQANLQVSSYTCPEGFQATELNSANFSKTSSKRVCKTCYSLFECCDEEPISSSAILKTRWCSTTKKPSTKQYYFAGVYSSIVNNIFTGTKKCPKGSFARLIGDDIKMCLSETKSELAVKFGGLFSCKADNPLVTVPTGTPQVKECPAGFSPQLAGIIQDCNIYYCVPMSKLPTVVLTTNRRPPFSPHVNVYSSDGEAKDAVYDPEKQEWLSDLKSRELEESDAVVALSAEEAAVIAIFVTLLFILLLSLAAFFYHRSKRNYSTDRRNGTTNAGQTESL